MDASPRYAVRFESNVTKLAGLSTESDRAHFAVMESVAGVVLEQVFLGLDLDVPEGDEPFRCETISASVARCAAAAAEALCDGEFTTDLVKFDGSFAMQQMQAAADSAAEVEEIQEFPDFHLAGHFLGWVHENVLPEDLVEVSTIFGTASAKTSRHLTNAMTIVYGLPLFADRVRAGEFTQAHVEVVAYLCQLVAFRYLPELDEYLSNRRADVTCESLRTALRKKINLLQPVVDRSDIAAQRRRIDVDGRTDGSACLTLSGPSAEIFACYNRIEAMARAVHGKNSGTFDRLQSVEISDDRSITQLMYDLMIRPVPEMKIKVKNIDPATGIQSVRDEKLFDDDGNLLFDVDAEGGLPGFADKSAPADGGSTFFSQEAPADDREYWISVRMPTSQWWLANQAATVVTVPFLTLTGDSNLPGAFADGSPVPAETARRIAGRSKTLQRILTDPATGTPIDAKATSYPVPKELRKTLVEQWSICTVPGCSRKAAKSEIDHVDPFFHLDPLKGGLTRFGNLHCLCKKHHALKTARKYSVRMPRSGVVEYEFTHGINASAYPPDQPVNADQALEFAALAHLRPQRWRPPTDRIHPPPSVLELMPGESTIRQRDEQARKAEQKEAQRRKRNEDFRAACAERRRLMIARALDWENAVFQSCLPAGRDRAATKQLTSNSRYAWRGTRIRNDRSIGGEEDLRRDPWSIRVDWEHDSDDPPPF